jgi:hypothetical protein
VSRLRSLLAAFALLVVAVVPAVQAAPTCTVEATRPACGNRVVAPALQSVTFLQHGVEYQAVLDAIESLAPDVIDVTPLGELAGMPELRSAGGLDIPIVRITDESVTTPKRQVAISLSVHANESAGREGGIRYIEDLARWSVSDPDHVLYAGDVPVKLSDVLRETEIYIGVLNPDGWADGDLGAGGTFTRGNANGQDLNRDFPTVGWTKRDQLTEPESQGWDALVSSLPNLTTATDIHGELTSANNAFSDIMYPAGQWSPKRQAQQLQIAEHMNRTVERKFAEEGVVLQTLFDLAGDDRPMKPAEFATAYDVVGYDDSGFMGDYFVSKGAVELDVENFLSHTVPSNVWVPALEQAHVAAVKGNMESVIAESMITDQVTAGLTLGRIAYVNDPVRVISDESSPTPYSVSRMQYFADLAADTGASVTPLAAADVATANLSAYDSIVLADLTIPQDPQGRAVDAAAYTAALEAFVRGGGQLVLTDRALELLPQLVDVQPAQITRRTSNAGHVVFGTLDHAWEQDLTPTASQTYYEVPLGYTASNQAPHYGVATSALQAVGGTSVGTFSNAVTTLGEIPLGEGSIALFGAILPTQTQDNRHDYGLADYGVTVAGGQVLHRILSTTR